METIDFWRFNARYAEEIYAAQPPEHSPTTWNRMEYRPLEGFVLAITPFNFLAIGSNLPSTPAQMGNVVLWKPSGTNMLANWHVFNILREAGLPDGVINFLPGRGAPVSDACFESRDFAGLHFTGSTPTFNALWKKMAAHIDTYRTYPRMVGETGGKNFHLVHESADIPSAVHHTVRAAFEYQVCPVAPVPSPPALTCAHARRRAKSARRARASTCPTTCGPSSRSSCWRTLPASRSAPAPRATSPAPLADVGAARRWASRMRWTRSCAR